LYRGSQNGFRANDFHSKCNNIANTLTIIKSINGLIFGGYTTKTWNGNHESKYDQNAFIFSITKKEKFNIKQDSGVYAIYGHHIFGPRFGGADISISDNCNNNNDSYSNFGSSYELP
jgi:hypothetical protein